MDGSGQFDIVSLCASSREAWAKPSLPGYQAVNIQTNGAGRTAPLTNQGQGGTQPVVAGEFCDILI